MITMGIDQSITCTGVFILQDDDVLFHTTIESSPRTGDVFLRVWLIVNELIDITKKYKPDLICIEGLSMGSHTGHLGDLGGLQHSIIMFLRFINNYNVRVVEPTVLKKFAYGKGNAKKWDMFDSSPPVIKQLLTDNYRFSSRAAKNANGSGFDVCDAYHLSKYAQTLIKI